jgi:hypothetical protein
MTDEQFAYQWRLRHELLFTVKVSYIYHRRRQRFFDLLDKGTKAVTVLAGGSLLAATIKEFLPLLAAVISGFGLLSLVFGYGDRKQAHKELAEAFSQLTAQIHKAGETTFTYEQVRSWQADLQQLNAKEPPSLHALVTICQNEVANAMGASANIVKLPWHQRCFASWVSFG